MSKLEKVMNDVEQVSPELFCVDSEDFKWLIEQAEKVEQLEKVLQDIEISFQNFADITGDRRFIEHIKIKKEKHNL